MGNLGDFRRSFSHVSHLMETLTVKEKKKTVLCWPQISFSHLTQSLHPAYVFNDHASAGIWITLVILSHTLVYDFMKLLSWSVFMNMCSAFSKLFFSSCLHSCSLMRMEGKYAELNLSLSVLCSLILGHSISSKTITLFPNIASVCKVYFCSLGWF